MLTAMIETGNSKRKMVKVGREENTSSTWMGGVGVPGGDFHDTTSRRTKWTKGGERQNSEEHPRGEVLMRQMKGNSRGNRRWAKKKREASFEKES